MLACNMLPITESRALGLGRRCWPLLSHLLPWSHLLQVVDLPLLCHLFLVVHLPLLSHLHPRGHLPLLSHLSGGWQRGWVAPYLPCSYVLALEGG